MNIIEVLARQAVAQPEQAAIIDRKGSRERMHTFQGLAEDAARAAALFHHHGIGKGDAVLVLQPMSYELYVALLAVFRLGAVAMFLDPSAGRAHVEQCCVIGNPRALVACPKAHLLRLVSPALLRIPKKFVTGRFMPGAVSLHRAAEHPPRQAIVAAEPITPALLTFTSGSTGKPKAALRSHGFLIAQHNALEQALCLAPGQTDLTTLPIFLLANLGSGVTSVIPDADIRYPGRVDAAPIIRQIRRHRITRSAGSPAFFGRLVEYCERHGETLSSLSRIDIGGAPVFPPLLQRLQRCAPDAQVVAVYGSTEAEPMAHIAYAHTSKSDMDAMRRGGGLLAGTPVPQARVRVIKDRFPMIIGPFTEQQFALEAMPVGETGEIVVSGEHVLKGYLHGEGDTETKFEVAGERWHRTGDAGYVDANGRLWLAGRCAARIEDTRGILYPFSVECAAQFVPGVRRSAMISHRGQRVLLVEAEASLDLSELSQALAWAQLDRVIKVDGIPVDKRHNAKVDYTQVQALLSRM